MEKFDPTGTTSKIKVRKYVQDQESLIWLMWNRIVDKQSIEINLQIHPHGLHAWYEMTEDGHDPTEKEDFFPSDYLEVEQILACYKIKMDPKVFAQQKTLNLQKPIFEMEEHNQGKKMITVALGKGSLGRNKSGSISKNIDKRGES